MYNHELTLIKQEKTTDAIGNEVITTTERKVLCKLKDVGSSEFYDAQVTGLKPEIKFIINSIEYEGEKEVVFEDNKYQIIRTYQGHQSRRTYGDEINLAGEEIELTCERVVGDG